MPRSSECFIGKSEVLHLGGEFIYVRYFDVINFIENDIYPYDIFLPLQLNAAAVKRKAEFIAGRVVACDAICALEEKPVQLDIGGNREPIWPKGFVGSISHNDKCAVAVAKYREPVLLGVDVENWMSQEQSVDLSGIIAGRAEVSLLKSLSLSYSQGLTILFSGKESLFKAIYPVSHRYFEFSDSKVVFWNEKYNYFVVELSSSVLDILRRNLVFKIFYNCEPGQVFTLAISIVD
ncbi:4'-phosphopantetheinyl transferase family protein [Vreelandella alkaliphila]|uniref:4'-phosphopantetheinyl transferase family protein n=1 Tax=Gammaproteobacteria TaxID=1236 RepID=UPI0018683322|nr:MULTISPECIES: 4'-phosphopantetheinyl transferase superfamily protein [Halomonas]